MSLDASIETLHARIAELEATVSMLRRGQEQKQQLFRQVFDKGPGMMMVIDRERRVRIMNERLAAYLRVTPEEAVGKLLSDFIPPSDMPTHVAIAHEEALRSGQPSTYRFEVRIHEEQRLIESIRIPILNDAGQPDGLLLVIDDITDRKREEEERTNLSRRVIEAQEAALREISTPLIPITDGVLVMPLIGTIDSTRAQQILESLLEGITSRRAQIAILDVTGLRVVDTHAAAALIQAAHSARLLGAQVLLTGIRAEVAQALVQLGADLSSLATLSNLQNGIAYALRQLGRSATG